MTYKYHMHQSKNCWRYFCIPIIL